MQISFAARAVLNKLNERLNQMNFLFAEFYDFERGLDPYFKRRLSQTPMEQRGKDWISIMWSRDPQVPSWNGRLYEVTWNRTSTEQSSTTVRFVYCSIIFTYISNSMSYLEECEKHMFSYIPDGFSTLFDNTPYKEWDANTSVEEGQARIARRYNDRIYRCSKSGITGASEPAWSTKDVVLDGTAEWTPEYASQLKVQFDNVAYSGMQKFNLDENDTLCKFEIGGRMFLPVLIGAINPDTGELDFADTVYNHKHKIIKYPRADISISSDRQPDYDEYVTPTPEYWRNLI